MWDLPGPGLEPVSPSLAGGFLTTAPPGKSVNSFRLAPRERNISPVTSVGLCIEQSAVQYNEVKRRRTRENSMRPLGIKKSSMEYYSAIKRNEMLPFAATWMDLENIMLSEISQTKRNTISLTCGI